MLISPAYAQGAGPDGGLALIMQLAPLLLIFGVFYFLLIRPQQKKAKDHKELLGKLKRGDKVLTAGGIIAKVTSVKDGVDEVEVEIAPNVRVSVLRSTIGDVLNPIPANDAAAKS
jgi:preprotein translocase subunit YajC